MAYATVADVQRRMTRTMSDAEQSVCATLLDDVGLLIDSIADSADNDAKNVVSCRSVIRALGDGNDIGVPLGATQGSMSALGYSQSWAIGSGGGAGELYLSKVEKRMLGLGNKIGSKSPTEDLVSEGCF